MGLAEQVTNGRQRTILLVCCFLLAGCSDGARDGVYAVRTSDRDPTDALVVVQTRRFAVGDGLDYLRPRSLAVGVCSTKDSCGGTGSGPWTEFADDGSNPIVSESISGPFFGPDDALCHALQTELRVDIDSSELELRYKSWDVVLPPETAGECFSWEGALEDEFADTEPSTTWTIKATQVEADDVALVDCAALSYESSGRAFFEDHCLDCHSVDSVDRKNAPLAVNFDSHELVKKQRGRIIARVGAGSMPLASVTEDRPSFDEVLSLLNWLECGRE